MDLNRLRIFACIAQEGSFTRAAKLLFTTQPTVSQQLAQLEREIGARLIERQTRRVRLTAAGEALLPFALKMLDLEATGIEAVRSGVGLADRTLRLGVGHLFTIYLLPELLRKYQVRHPDWPIHISAGNTAELLDMLVRGTVEIALVGSPGETQNAEITPFMEDRLVAIVSSGDRWANRKEVSPVALLERTLITREHGSALHGALEILVGTQRLERANKIELVETEAIKRCVEAGLGVAVIQQIAVEREAQAGALRMLRVMGSPDTRTYSYAARRGVQLSTAARSLIHLLTGEVKSLIRVASDYP